MVASTLRDLLARDELRAHPDVYAAALILRLKESGACELIFGYGQRIYLMIEATLTHPRHDIARFEFLPFAGSRFVPPFEPTAEERVRDLSYTVEEQLFSGATDTVARPFSCDRRVEFSTSPFPVREWLPFAPPTVFWCHSGVSGAGV